jgi:hypothetical protein
MRDAGPVFDRPGAASTSSVEVTPVGVDHGEPAEFVHGAGVLSLP